MHIAILGSVLVGAWLIGFSGSADAQYRQVCAIYRDGSMLCYYDTFDQCYQAISGLGRATCVVNPGYDPALDRRSR